MVSQHVGNRSRNPYQVTRTARSRSVPPARPRLSRAVRRTWPTISRWAVTTCIALAAALAIQQSGMLTAVGDALLALNFDTTRVTLIQQALTTTLAALVAAMALKQRTAAWVGAMVYFALSYLGPFVAQAHSTAIPVGGIRAVLLPQALRSTVIVLAGIGGTLAALGVVTGAALADLLIVPAGVLARWMFTRRLHLPVSAVVRIASGLVLLAMAVISIQHIGGIITIRANKYAVPLRHHRWQEWSGAWRRCERNVRQCGAAW